MSVIGNERSLVIKKPFTLPTAKFTFFKPIPIINGTIKFYAKQFGCIIEVPVRQVKSRSGSYTADKIFVPSKAHLEIITYLFDEYQKHGDYAFKPEKLLKHMNKWLRKHGKKSRISSSGVVGRCSELARKQVLLPAKYGQYKLNYERALQVLNRMEF